MVIHANHTSERCCKGSRLPVFTVECKETGYIIKHPGRALEMLFVTEALYKVMIYIRLAVLVRKLYREGHCVWLAGLAYYKHLK